LFPPHCKTRLSASRQNLQPSWWKCNQTWAR
jgi:hypothetical protein